MIPFALSLIFGSVNTHSVEGTISNETFDGTLRRIYSPILMYHYVSELPEDADEYRQGLTISPAQFRDQMDFLRTNGYETISLYQLDNALNFGAQLPENPIVLTFDDGYIDHFNNVFPVLNEFGYIGTFFVITDRLDNNDPQYLTWEHAQIMEDAGMSIESHTKSHPDLRNRNYDYLVFQVLGSIESIEGHVEQPSSMFSYPSGRYDENTLEILGTMPIQRAVTTENGAWHTTDNRLEVTRLRISGNMGAPGLRQLLNASLTP